MISWPDGLELGPDNLPYRQLPEETVWSSTVWVSNNGVVRRVLDLLDAAGKKQAIHHPVTSLLPKEQAISRSMLLFLSSKHLESELTCTEDHI